MQIAAGAVENESADEEGYENTTETEECILVGSSADEGDDEDEG